MVAKIFQPSGKQQQEHTSPDHAKVLFLGPVCCSTQDIGSFSTVLLGFRIQNLSTHRVGTPLDAVLLCIPVLVVDVLLVVRGGCCREVIVVVM